MWGGQISAVLWVPVGLPGAYVWVAQWDYRGLMMYIVGHSGTAGAYVRVAHWDYRGFMMCYVRPSLATSSLWLAMCVRPSGTTAGLWWTVKSVTSIEEYVLDPAGQLFTKVTAGSVRPSGTFVCSSGSLCLMWSVAAHWLVPVGTGSQCRCAFCSGILGNCSNAFFDISTLEVDTTKLSQHVRGSGTQWYSVMSQNKGILSHAAAKALKLVHRMF